MGWWSSIFTTRVKDWTYSPLEPQQVPGNVSRERVAPDTCYLSVFLQSLRVVDVRRGLTRFYGAVHSHISLPHLSGKTAEFNVLTTPSKLKDVDAKRVDQVIQIGQRLLGPVPYRGGDLEMEVGLFSIKSADLAAPFLSVLEKMSSLAGVSYINAALPFAEPLKEGINLLTGGEDDSVLEIGVAVNNPSPETGYYLVMRAPKGTINVNDIRVDGSDYRLVDRNAQPFGDYPYMILQVVASRTRDDWFKIPELSKPYQALKDDVRKGDYGATKESLVAFKRTVLTCDDLLAVDARNLVTKVETEVRAVMSITQTAKGRRRSIPDLGQIPLYSK